MTKYPTSEVQLMRSTLLTEAAKPSVKRSAREIAEERWGLQKKSRPRIAEGASD
jgi:hypothetical protein